ncbi:hypothetical protein CW705_00865 [Candidatus Bathyarchaeota archaeon]|nr:MAG: hypothetical protein CW705_00865 [Candidatus Bathyarchaeota archaeon]
MDGEDFKDWKSLLLVAGGYVINTNMKSGRIIATGSKDLKKIEVYNGGITCGTDWGSSPTLVEGIPVIVKIKTQKEITVWALNNIGERTQKTPISSQGDFKVFRIGPEYETLWYEISAP